jgi:hypothetical protein
VAQVILDGDSERIDLLKTVLDSCLPSLQAYTGQGALKLPIDYRLAFRELGLSIGLRAVERLKILVEEHPAFSYGSPALQSQIDALLRYVPLADEIEEFWREPNRRESESWTAHRDINMVMLATSLAPDGYLTV